MGNTCDKTSGSCRSSVHPHACGEHNKNLLALYFGYGSSPRLWGTPRVGQRQRRERRFIPTPVGNTSESFFVDRLTTVHPHACGEHMGNMSCSTVKTGSSPRLWGTLQRSRLSSRNIRFIPTPVGNTRPAPDRDTSIPVHPHACGEHVYVVRGASG